MRKLVLLVSFCIPLFCYSQQQGIVTTSYDNIVATSAMINGIQMNVPYLGSRLVTDSTNISIFGIKTIIDTVITSNVVLKSGYRYYVNVSSGVDTLTLPSSFVSGNSIQIVGTGGALWRIKQNAGQSIIGGTSSSTQVGTGGYINSQTGSGCISLRAISSTTFNIENSQGSPIFYTGNNAWRYLTPSSAFIPLSPAITSVTNTTTETTVFVDTIRGNTLGLVKQLNLNSYFSIVSALVPPSVTVRVYYGSTAIATFSSVAINSSTTSGFWINMILAENGSSASQFCFGQIIPNAILSLSASSGISSGSYTINSAIDQTLRITVQFGSALTGTTLTPLYARAKIE
jgi:hypothetical protein